MHAVERTVAWEREGIRGMFQKYDTPRRGSYSFEECPYKVRQSTDFIREYEANAKGPIDSAVVLFLFFLFLFLQIVSRYRGFSRGNVLFFRSFFHATRFSTRTTNVDNNRGINKNR